MKSGNRDKAFLLDCLMSGGDIKGLAEFAVDAGWTPRKFRVFCEFMLIRDDK